MRKIILTLALALSLTGCASLQNIETAVQLGTATVANPVTKTRLNQMESSVIIVFAGLKAWKTSCQQGLIPATCRDQIAQVQVFTRQIPPYLSQLRRFVRNNDQINATVAFNQLIELIGTVKSQAAVAGRRLGVSNMDIASILALVGKGVSVIKTLYEAEQDIAPAVKVVANLITGAQSGTVTDDELAATEATLDGMIDDFNKPMT